MRFCKIENNKVTNIIKAEQSFIDTLSDVYVASETAFVGQEYVGGAFVTPVVVEPTIDELKAEKITLVQNKYEVQRVALITVPTEEKATWDEQRKEYEACVTTEATATTPIVIDETVKTEAIDGLVAGDNLVGGTITKAELLTKIGQNITAYKTAVATITGMQHGYERKINACTTPAELDLIVV